MGTIIRTAAAVGCDQVLLTKGSVNPWVPKVLRSSMGAHFRIKIIDRIEQKELYEKYLFQFDYILLAESNESKCTIDYTQIGKEIKMDRNKKVVIVIGNEAHGIRNLFCDNLKNSLINKKIFSVRIPLENSIESLNCSIAFSIIAYEIRKILNQ